MAKIKTWRGSEEIYNKTIGAGLGVLNKVVDSAINTRVGERITQGLLNKGWRALLFVNRAGLTPPILGGSPPSRKYTGEGLTSSDKAEISKDNSHFKDISSRRILVGRDLRNGHSFNTLQTYGVNDPSAETMLKGNQVIIINPCVVDSNGNPDKIILQNRPKELEYQPQSSWADIKSMGRNTPFYHYTGGAIELHFNTSWYMPGKPGEQIPDKLGGGDFNPYWVLNQCRKLEAWTMANGYAQCPPVLMIRWGNSDLFQDFLWILKSATYKLMDFHDRAIDMVTPFTGEYSVRDTKLAKYIDQGLIPYSATQELIFQRVAGINLWYNDIMPYREITNQDTLGQLEDTQWRNAEVASMMSGVDRSNQITRFNLNPPYTSAVIPEGVRPQGTLGNISRI